MPMTVVLPVPVAILQAWRRNARIPSASAPGWSNGDINPLQEVRARLGEADDRLGGLELGEEQAVPSSFPAPVAQQLHGRPCHAALAA